MLQVVLNQESIIRKAIMVVYKFRSLKLKTKREMLKYLRYNFKEASRPFSESYFLSDLLSADCFLDG
jgi:hypothetical protein